MPKICPCNQMAIALRVAPFRLMESLRGALCFRVEGNLFCAAPPLAAYGVRM